MSVYDESKVYKPFKYSWAVELTQEHDAAAWHEKEAKLQNDVLQWNNGTIRGAERAFITNVLKMFTQSDVAVGSTYKKHLIPVLRNNEISNMLTSFAGREGVHQRAYALLNETLGLDDSVWSEFLEEPTMAAKADLMTHTDDDLALQVARLALSEGVSLFASFVMLLEFGTRGKMLGMCEVVEWSIRDETLHVQGNTRLFKEMHSSALEPAIQEVAAQMVAAEDAFIEKTYQFYTPESLPCEDLKTYIRYITDRRLQQMGLEPMFNVSLPDSLHWVDAIISGASDKNFFEGVVTDYSLNGMDGDIEWEKIV